MIILGIKMGDIGIQNGIQKMRPHGRGLMFFNNGNVYEGQFCEGLPFGNGRILNVNGQKYEGQVKFGRANGQGVFCDGTYLYQGGFKDDRKDGFGIETLQSQYKFQGTFQNGDKIQGIFTYKGNKYQGAFFQNAFSGQGELTIDIGNHYKGHFKNGQFDGYGEFTWKNGSFYRGNYVRGKQQGQGQYYDSKNGTISKGIWEKGILNGPGEYTDAKKRKISCRWDQGKMQSIQTQ